MIVTLVVPKDVPAAEVVQGLFDLTPAEARVARQIGRGRTVDEVATASGLSPGTVRGQVKSILGKTGLHRQAELIGLLRGIPTVDVPDKP
jgi:DNA-binding CsgD family transcriptional regulator